MRREKGARRMAPFKVTQGHWNLHESIGYAFLLPPIGIHSNHAPI